MNGQPGKDHDQLPKLLHDIETMRAYASESGKPVPPRVAERLAHLRSREGSGESMSEASAVHAELSKIVAPATPKSIETTQPSGDSFVGRLLVRNPAIQLLVGLTMGSLVLFLVVNTLLLGDKATGAFVQPALLLLAASLGAGFHALLTAHRFIVHRTFDPQYNQSYLIRYVLGLTAGMILGYFGKELLAGRGDAEAMQLGTAALALVGGFAADAVAEILTRVSDILVAVVKGGQREQLDAREAEIRAEEERKQREKGLDAAKRALDLATDSRMDEQMRIEVEKLANSLMA